MKKVLCLISVFLILSGCAVESQNIKPITKGLSFNAEINYNKITYECIVKIAKNGDCEIEYILPKELEGLKTIYSANKVTADYKGLNYQIDDSLPQNSISDIIHKIFKDNYDTVFSNNDNYYVENKNLNCKMYIGATGLPIEITENHSLFCITIKNATINEKEP